MSFLLLLTALSDGKPRHVTELAQIAQTTPAQLNGLWQQAPQHLHSLLRQNDGYWKLAKAIALLPENTQHLKPHPPTHYCLTMRVQAA